MTISASSQNHFFFSVLSVEAMGEPIVVSSLGIILVSMNNQEINLYDDYTENKSNSHHLHWSTELEFGLKMITMNWQIS